jgi:predicted small secreted protein
MVKKAGCFIVLAVLCVALFSGCETTVGAAKGVAYGVGATAVEVSRGIDHDARNTYSFIKETDDWIRENLW